MSKSNQPPILPPLGPQAQGMYDPALDKDSCGVGFIANYKGKRSRDIVDKGIRLMCNLEHRGAEGADPKTGDGAGIMINIPDAFFRKNLPFTLPKEGDYAVGFLFLPQNTEARTAVENVIEKIIVDEGEEFLGFRDVPINKEYAGVVASKTIPVFKQVFIGKKSKKNKTSDDFERKLFLIRRLIDRRIRSEMKLDRSQYYVPSFSSRTIVYKGMLLGDQVKKFYEDLKSPDLTSAFCLTHTRFSTNTFPTWDLAHPYRQIAHNGEINTLRGNMNWMAARQMVMQSPLYGDELRRMLPIVMEGQSDTATFDTVLELLVMGGRSLPHSVMMMIPEAWSKNKAMDADRRAFYEYHATFMEPWDGPAAIAFTDGRIIGATLDRNGLRPARFVVTKDDEVIMSSEAGVLNLPPEEILIQDRLRPGRMLLIDMEKGQILDDEEIKKQIATQKPYRKWVEDNMIRLGSLPDPENVKQPQHETILERQRAFGYTHEDVFTIIKPMGVSGEEPIGSMGVDSSLAVLSEKPQPLFRYFKQNFAQVTNPPIDPIREELVMELTTYIGPEGNLLSEEPEHAHRLELEHPILTNEDFEKIKQISEGHFKAKTFEILFDPSKKHDMRNSLDRVCADAAKAVREQGVNLIILTDHGVGEKKAAIPSLLAVAGLHHYLIREGLRTKAGIVLESGEPREVAHFALLCGYGANAINPYLAFETIADLSQQGLLPEIPNYKDAKKKYIKSIGKGLFKVFSKMGISTLQSYCGAQIFEAVGLDSELVNTYFAGTQSRIEGLSLEMLEEETVRRHKAAYDPTFFPNNLEPGGVHYYRKNGDSHLYTPITVHKLQKATQDNDYKTFKEFSSLIDNQNEKAITLRSLFQLDFEGSKAIPIEEVESVKSILKRFQTGAMSHGSISWEAHTTLAIAMNRIGAKSNTGEGGEDPVRFKTLPNGDSMRSAIKQVASARFGVTMEYLTNADDIQIKMAQGAKPGEGGQLPGHKVDKYIGWLRYSTPGVTLISPPPHHDIYSIEDLKQLIFDLKNSNPRARVSVKLVSESGVGTVAAGVAKAHADHILIAGHEGGTGASPISSIHHAGTPWELGLSETHQTLVANGLRDRVYLAVDGKLLTGKDVVVGALLGAEEFGFSTSALVSVGCIMMRKCHLNTCPVGVATQDEFLRSKFTGKPEYVVNFMTFVAEEVREIMAKLGFRTFEEMIGQVEKIKFKRPHHHWKARGLDFSKVLHRPTPVFPTGLYRAKEQNHHLDEQIDNELIRKSLAAIDHKQPVKIQTSIVNLNRSVGTMLSHEVTKKYGVDGLSEDTIDIEFTGTAGQSFGAFVTKGMTLRLIGEGNDYVGKGLCGGKLIFQTPKNAPYKAEENIVIGNTCFIGATSGNAYVNGIAGERFCVRNSGAHVIVEGTGDHGCEYMTGGRVIILGDIGRNFAAGMSGGIAYLWDPKKNKEALINKEMVDLDPLTDASEIAEVKKMVEDHKAYTGSKRAEEVLKDWDTVVKQMIKVIPRDYKKALEKMAEEATAGKTNKEGVTARG
ncbi:glutamate synthase large subunit [Leptospira meyeri]|uniref:glutamate synthase large subunit n=1 Tax=Leptospira meyeri TaxID=29508 RepID=UPI000C2A85A7|nr:glutamate synthase large subunit [Leptospira meyeri]MCW7490756.1 glutamate synthase large subunit [Leptospira meyeri]PKA24642.1 glutamate synthase large subunit [Leptospira sp. mixed culture ATI2-C-A1]